jgi:hypothetical protein
MKNRRPHSCGLASQDLDAHVTTREPLPLVRSRLLKTRRAHLPQWHRTTLAVRPENSGGPQAAELPRHNGSPTRATAIAAATSLFGAPPASDQRFASGVLTQSPFPLSMATALAAQTPYNAAASLSRF